MIKLALTDLDDTLIPFGSASASDRAIAAMHAMMAAGLHVGPVSGRIPAAMSWMFGGDEACCATGAFVNGQIVYLDGEPIHVESVDTALLERVMDVCDAEGDAVLLMFDPYVDDGGSFVTTRPAQLARMMGNISGPGFRPNDWVDHVLTGLSEPSYIKVNVRVNGSRERVTQVRDLLRAECPGLSFVFPSMSVPIIDITPAGWDKGSAVGVLARALGIGLHEIAAFGDSENDLAMLKAVPNSVAVANASPEVAQAARWHIGASKDEAVAAAFEDIAAAATTGTPPAFMQV